MSPQSDAKDVPSLHVEETASGEGLRMSGLETGLGELLMEAFA